MSESVIACRICGKTHVKPILSFGKMPLADMVLEKEQLGEPESLFPLDLVFCPHCILVQITETVPSEILYGADYPYFSSASHTLVQHFGDSTRELMKSRKLDSSSLVIEIASNDGCMLKNFVESNISVLGIDPGKGPAEVAEKAGVPTLCTFFDKQLSRKLREEGRLADVILANNVLNIASDLDDFVEGIRLVLKETDVAVIESPYAVNTIDRCEFDMVFHQSLSYFSATALDRLFRRHSLFVNDIRHVPTFGGSLRIFVEPDENVLESVKLVLEEETA